MSYNIRECANAFPEFASACYQSLRECDSAVWKALKSGLPEDGTDCTKKMFWGSVEWVNEARKNSSPEEVLQCGKNVFWAVVEAVDQSTKATMAVVALPIAAGLLALKAKRPYVAAGCFGLGIAAIGMKIFCIYDQAMKPGNYPNSTVEEKEDFSQEQPHETPLQLESAPRVLPTYYSSQPLVSLLQGNGQCPVPELI